MKPVKTIQKYKCDFCKYRSIRSRVELHEKRCFRNPNRFCDNCENEGYTIETEHNGEESWQIQEPCYYCSKFDPKMLKEIEEREKVNNGKLPDTTIEFESGELPF